MVGTIKHLYNSQWMVALASFFLMISTGGALNNFSLFSQHLKLSLDYNQKNINTISLFKDVGTSVGILSGLVYDLTGPWVVLLLGFALNFAGYFTIWLATTQRIAHPHVWELCFYLFMIGASAAFTTTAVLVACAKNFPKNQGMVLSLLDSTQGLSVAIFTLLYQAFFSHSDDSFVLLLAWFPSLLCLLFAFFIRSVPLDGRYNDSRTLFVFVSVTLILAGYLMAIIILQHFVRLESRIIKAFFSIMLIILSIPVLVVLRQESKTLRHRHREEVDVDLVENAAIETPQTDYQDVDPPDHGADAAAPAIASHISIFFFKGSPVKRGDDFTIFQALCSIDMFLIFVASTCGIGAVLTVTNNFGQIGTSLGYSQAGTNTFIALLSIWDFIGGVGVGFISDICLASYGVARPFFLCLVLLLLSLGSLIIALGLPGALFYGSVLIGLSIGGQWSVLYTMIAEIFGLRFYGTLQNVTYVAKALGTYVLSVRVAGVLYDRESKLGPSNGSLDGDELLCHGPHCYRTTFFVMAGVCLFASIVSLILSIRTTKFYSVTLRKRLTG
ncbi:uncharacterized protein LOC112347701 [Selaginella moellendorffii]|uniref:uncharacterized protein LOC112347701 n=1 Tax=Selaginella moellendorffii TaxID=88036 RepID=UPI000D1C726E|nr:uncharacterized protein LOC112347701 [Selaginella moellendorffii]|eukprot:XP_024534799.1 uncharacterized protein LOC112347701 [Selaginella moellendorffii]